MKLHQQSQNLTPVIRVSALSCLAALLVACGGGGDGAVADEPATPQLTGTQGNAAAYRGVWRTECGVLIEGTELRGVKVVLEVTSATGSTASGRLTKKVFFDTRGCAGGLASTDTTQDMTLTIDPAAVSVTGDFAGTADKVTMSAQGATASTNYFGFLPDRTGLYISSSSTFSGGRLLYSKAAQ
jgi:hypothetical protein